MQSHFIYHLSLCLSYSYFSPLFYSHYIKKDFIHFSNNNIKNTPPKPPQQKTKQNKMIKTKPWFSLTVIFPPFMVLMSLVLFASLLSVTKYLTGNLRKERVWFESLESHQVGTPHGRNMRNLALLCPLNVFSRARICLLYNFILLEQLS